MGIHMSKKAIITAKLVTEASEVSNSQIEEDIGKSIQCNWLAQVEKVTVENET